MPITETCTCLTKYKRLALRHLGQLLSLRPSALRQGQKKKKKQHSDITENAFFKPLLHASEEGKH